MSAYKNVPFPLMSQIAAIAANGNPVMTFNLVNTWMRAQVQQAHQHSYTALAGHYGEKRQPH